MGHDELDMMQKAVNLMDLMEDYVMEAAKTLDEINKKLDILFYKKDWGFGLFLFVFSLYFVGALKTFTIMKGVIENG